MSKEAGSSGSTRVVALLGPAAGLPELSASVETIRTTSGYEAAAELLAGPASALLVDLGRITAAHVPLLALAGRLEVPVVAFGTVSASLPGSALSALRLVGVQDIAAAIEETLSTAASPAAEAAALDAVPAGQEERPRPRRAELRPARAGDRRTAQEQPEPAAADWEPSPQPPLPRRPKENLTQAELDALLGELDALLEESP